MFDEIFQEVEAAIDAHPELLRHGREASMHVSRSGFEVRIVVKLKGSRKSATAIHGSGDTAAAAARDLVEHLDIWAGALR